ncbi:hypothetical protein PAE9249_03726 [Paenibacillus sp. CECT 9249]|nr:hypothetical protein PAE9249_03726 [Paenibacillus sp. CECT 9249]
MEGDYDKNLQLPQIFQILKLRHLLEQVANYVSEDFPGSRSTCRHRLASIQEVMIQQLFSACDRLSATANVFVSYIIQFANV